MKSNTYASRRMPILKFINIQRLLFFGFLMVLLPGYAQVGTYTFSQTVGTYSEVPTASATVAYTAPWDNHTNGSAYQAALPFTFIYDGNPYTSCFISPNGFLIFGSTQPASTLYAPLSNTAVFNGAVCGMGFDLISNGSDITYTTLGTSPNRIFVVQYKNAVRKGTDAGNFNFQIRLLETSNAIEFSYGHCAPEGTTARNVQVGLRGATNNYAQRDVINRLLGATAANTTWGASTVNGTANNSSVKTAIDVYPENGLKYTYTPSAGCVMPTGAPSNFVLGTTSITQSAFNGNSFSLGTSTASNFLILRSTQNIPPTSAQIPNRTYWTPATIIDGTYTVVSVADNTITTFLQSGLQQDTTYYYWIIPFNSGCLGGPVYNLSAMISKSATTCLPVPVLNTTTNIEGNAFTMNWTDIPGTVNYVIDVSTNAGFTALVPGYANLSVGNLTSYTVTGVQPLTRYYFRVRATGNSDCLRYSTSASITTGCGYYTVPYTQNFDTGVVLPNLPNCFEFADDNNDGVHWITNNSNAASSPNALRLNKSTATTANDWFFLPGLQLTAGMSYRLKFRYNTTSNNQFVENLRVRLGSGQTPPAMNITILDLPSLTNTIYQTAVVDFNVVTDGVYYLGFQGYSFANQSTLYVDDISVTYAPTCFEPTNVSVSAIGTNSVTLTWDPSSPEPSNGYQYYISTNNINPISTTIPTGSVGAGVETITITTALNPSTTYYVWVRGNCGGSKSEWSIAQVFSTECIAPQIMSVTNVARCGLGSAVLSAVPNTGSTIEWYETITGGTPIFTGTSFTTPMLTNTTTYYAQAFVNGGAISVGRLNPIISGGEINKEIELGSVFFTITSRTTLQSVDIYSITSGQSGAIVLKNSANQVLGTFPFTTSGVAGSSAQAIPINTYLQPGNYSLQVTTMPNSGLIVNLADATYPYTSSVANITGNSYDNGMYMYFYNWRFTTECVSVRTPATITVTNPPALSFSTATVNICEGASSELVTVIGTAAFNSFTISPNTGVTGSATGGYVFNPVSTTTYTLIGNQTSGGQCAASATITVMIDPAPPTIIINPSTITVCEDEVVPLTASLGSASQTVIYTENFEGTTQWTATQMTTGSSNAAATNWIVRQSPFNYASPYWVTTLSSNDASKFFMTFADAGGSGSNTRSILQSPDIDLTGYNNATLTFWHYIRRNGVDIAAVQVSIDGGASWNDAATYTISHTPDKVTGFVQANVNLLNYVGHVVKIRFYYDSRWNYGWAVDNISISASLALGVNWTPAANLYTDAAGTIPYDSVNPASVVYAKLSANTSYTARVAGFNGCFATATTAITVQEKPEGGTISAPQNLCAASHGLEDIVLLNSHGTVVRWEYANDAAFTSGVGVINHYTTTLPASLFGSFTTIRYFRAVLGNGVCAILRSPVTSVSYSTTTWNGSAWSNGVPSSDKKVIFNGNYTSSGRIDACSVEVISGLVKIESGHSLVVENEVKVNGGQLVFENDASLIQINGAVNTGAILYKRNSEPMLKYDFTYWSSPVGPQTLSAFSPNTRADKYFKWDAGTYTWKVEAGSVIMNKGQGYIVRAPDTVPFNSSSANVFYGQFSGVPNNGTVPFSIVVNGANYLNLLGNPYPSAIHADDLFEATGNENVLAGTIYLWTHNTPITNLVYSNDDYAVYNGTGGVGTRPAINSGLNMTIPDGTIAAGQGFFVKGLASGSGYFNNSMRLIGSNSAFYKLRPNTKQGVMREKHRIWLDISNDTGLYKQMMLGYISQATNGYDPKFDAESLSGDNLLDFYTILEEKALTIQGKGLPFAVDDRVPLGFSTTIAGAYVINIAQADGLFAEGQRVYIEDTYTNTIHDITEHSYHFVTTSGIFEDRFVLRYTAGNLQVDQPKWDASIVAFKEHESVVVKSTQAVLQQVVIYDIRGRQLTRLDNINDTKALIQQLPDTRQLILVHITTKEGYTTVKKIVY